MLPLLWKATALAASLDLVIFFARRAVPEVIAGAEAGEPLAIVRALGGDKGFFPTPWLGGSLVSGHMQTIWYGLKLAEPDIGEVDVHTWITADGGTLGLAWPEVDLSTSAPICLVLPGLCGSVHGTGHSTQAIIRAGMRPVVWHARGCGHELTSPNFNLFGSTADLDEAISLIVHKYPKAPLTLYGISAGTALMVRYLGEKGGGSNPVIAVR